MNTSEPDEVLVSSDPIARDLGLTLPTGFISTAEPTIQDTILFDDTSLTGTCAVSFALMQGTIVRDKASLNVALKPSVWLVQFSRTRPATVHSAGTAVGVQVRHEDRYYQHESLPSVALSTSSRGVRF